MMQSEGVASAETVAICFSHLLVRSFLVLDAGPRRSKGAFGILSYPTNLL